MASQTPFFENLDQVSNPLSNWYADNDGPWVMTSTVSTTPNGHLMRQTRAFPGYRDQAGPSEPGTVINATVPSDSGYLSYPQHSIADSSLCEDGLDRVTETASITGGFNAMRFDFFDPLPPGLLHFDQPVWRTSADNVADNAADSVHNDPARTLELWCSVCKRQLKTKSDKKKHIKRHTKPHRCEIHGCRRKEGFGTTNDLERHIRSCHPEQSNAPWIYLCPLQKCMQRTKEWSRADNFRAHIKRVHKDVELSDDWVEKCRHKSRNPPRDPNITLSHGVHQDNPAAGPARTSSIEHTNSWATSHDSELQESKERCESEQAFEVLLEEDEFMPSSVQQQGNMEWTSAQQDYSAVSTTSRHSTKDLNTYDTGSFNVGKPSSVAISQGESLTQVEDSHYAKDLPKQEQGPISLDHNGSHDILLKGVTPHGTNEVVQTMDNKLDFEEGDPIVLEDSPLPSHFNIDLNNQVELGNFLGILQKRGILQHHGYTKEPFPPSDGEGQLEIMTTNSPGSKGSFGCPSCPKTFARRCELRKHEKRHDKPFGCTFAGCKKRFGSKNDWKRHENSQHQLHEMWKCDERHPSVPSQLCSRADHSAEDFRNHLSSAHGISDMQQLDSKIKHCYVGGNYDERFWCGFCNKIVHTKSKEQGAWMERFNHIGNHYADRGGQARQRPEDWKHVYIENVVPTGTDSVRGLKRTVSMSHTGVAFGSSGKQPITGTKAED